MWLKVSYMTMKMGKKNEHGLGYYLEYLFALFTVLQANTLYYNNWGRQVTTFWLILCLSLMFGSLYNLYRKSVNIYPLMCLYVYYVPASIMLLAILFVFKDSINKQKYIMAFFIIPTCLFPFLYERCLKEKEYYFFNKIKNIILILASISLAGWTLSIFKVPTNSFISSSWGSTPTLPGYFHIHFIAQGSTAFLGINIIRNTGIFVEAPMFSYVLCLGLLIELFINKNRSSKFIILIFVFTIFTTASTTGVVIAAASLFYYKFIVKSSSVLFNLPIISLGLLLLIIFIKFMVYHKFNPNWASSSSLRMNDYYAGYKAWSQHILLGNGLDNNQSIINFMDPRRIVASVDSPGIIGFSNGIMQVLAFGGVALLTNFYIIPTIMGVLSSKKIAGVSLFCFILFCTTIVSTLFIYITILSFFLINFIISRSKGSKYI